MKTRISRKYHFSAAHRIEGHPKCGRLHGHNYVVEVTLIGELGSDGMVLDFGRLDGIVNPFLDQFDHRYLASNSNSVAMDPIIGLAVLQPQWVCFLPIEASTAECLALYFYDEIGQAISVLYPDSHFDIEEVVVWETDRSKASAR